MFNVLNKYKIRLFNQNGKPSNNRKPGEARRKQRPKYKSFRLHKHIKPNNFVALPSAWSVLVESIKLLFRNKKTVSIFIILYIVAYILMVKSFSSSIDLAGIRSTLSDSGISINNFFTSAVLLSSLMTSANFINSEAASVNQAILFVLGSLSMIWLVRKFSVNQGEKISVKQSFYQGMGQLFPFMGVLAFLMIEIIPLLAGLSLVSIISADNFSYAIGETFAIWILALTLFILSLYLFSGSIAAIYIVTLPGAEPIKSIKFSHKILTLHRWSVFRKLLMLLIFIFFMNLAILIPLTMYLPINLSFIAEYLLMILSVTNLIIVHNFLYTMYKKLI